MNLRSCSPTRWYAYSREPGANNGFQLRVPKQKKFSLKPGTLSPNKVGRDYLEPIEGTT